MANKYFNIDPDEIFLDSTNLPDFDNQQFEGRIEKPISRLTLRVISFSFAAFFLILIWNISAVQLKKGDSFRLMSENNNLRHIPIFASRGVVYDRNKVPLAYNESGERRYLDLSGLAHVLGYVGLPNQNKVREGNYLNEMTGKDGLESAYDQSLKGERGLKIEEVNVKNDIISGSVLKKPIPGKDLISSIDSRLQHKMHQLIETLAMEKHFGGGAGVIMDVENGEIIAMTSYPEYLPNILSAGEDKKAIKDFLTDPRKLFLNRAMSGLYAPGSIVKPFFAAAALEEKIISPDKKIHSSGQLTVKNPYNPDKPTVFKDWRAHGWTNMREAIAYSSDVYFYQIGGGFEEQKGLGIERINKYASLFGFGRVTGIEVGDEAVGLVPSPKWKEENFQGEKWNIGNTYHTAIGQYGFQITPLQAARAIAAVSNGKIVTPKLIKDNEEMPSENPVGISERNLQIVREGMRMAVTVGTAKGLFMDQVEIAAKTGTAELGTSKEKVNSWVIGFFPYKTPRYAFAVVMERGDSHNTIGGVYVMRQLFDWMFANTPEYFN